MVQQRGKRSGDANTDSEELVARLAGPLAQLGNENPLAVVAFALRSGLRVRRLMTHWTVSQGITLALRIGREYCVRPDEKSRGVLANALDNLKWDLDRIERHAPTGTVPDHVESASVARLNDVVQAHRQGNFSGAAHWAKIAAKNAFDAARLAVEAKIVSPEDRARVERSLIRDLEAAVQPRDDAAIDPGPDGPFGALWGDRNQCPGWEPSEQWHSDLTRIDESEMTRLVDYADRNAKFDDVLKGESLPERPGAIQSLESIGRDIEQAAAPFPGEFGRALREGLPVNQAVSILSAQADALHRPIVEALRGLLSRLHEEKSLGSYEENARAAEEVYRLAKACNVDLVFEGQAVSIDCRPRDDVKSGIFKLRTLNGNQRFVYQRTSFPPLDVRISEKPADNQHPESTAAKGDVGRAVSALSEQIKAVHRPVVDELRGLLTRLHEAKNLGSYEENARAAEEVYRLAKACGQDLIYEGTPVALQALDKKNYKTGVFKLRTFGLQQKTVYQRVDFPPLDVRTSEKSAHNVD